MSVSGKVKRDILNIYNLIAQAESTVHGVPVTEIHFHEVGALDALADIGSVCLLMEALAPQRVAASAVHVGSGRVECAHGILPVPAPATALLLKGIPTYGGEIQGELCTPTGAALLKYFVTDFGPQPVMQVEGIGYGMGKKDFPAANCLRAFWGETGETGDRVVQLECNLDDMTGEAIGFAMETLLNAGALEVFTVPLGMKKNRPGTLLCVLCRQEQREEMIGLIFRHTTTLGVRESLLCRSTLERRMEVMETPYGVVRKKIARGFGVTREKYEYEDLARIAREKGISLGEAAALIK